MSVIRRALSSGAVLIGATTVATLLAEAALHLTNLDWSASFTTGDRDLGWSHRPSSEGWFLDEGGAFVRINSDGMRDVERTPEKPADVLRIAVVGDSTTESWQVDLEKTWPRLAEKKLSAECSKLGGRRVEMLNFGVSGYGTGQELIMLRKKVWKYSPDLVLLAFFPGNDLYNNIRALNPSNPSHTPYFTFAENGELVLDDSFLEMPELDPAYIDKRNQIGTIMNHSRLLRGMYAAYLRAGKMQQAHAASAPPIKNSLYAPPASGDLLEQSWKVTEALLLAIRDEVHAHDADLWLTAMTIGIQVHPDPAARQDYARAAGAPDLDYPNRRLEMFAQANEIAFLDQLAPMRARAEAGGRPLHGFPENGRLNDGHLNEEGNAALAEIIAGELCERALPPPSI